MRKRIVIAGILLLVAIFAWRQNRVEQAGHDKSSASAHHSGTGDEGSVAAASSLPGKSGNRKDPAPLPTHGPHRLKDFFLPEVDVTGLSLAAALDKLRAAYVEVCGQTGEVPLQVAFDVPPGHGKPLRIKLGLRSLDNSVRLLAAAAGMKVKRDGATYHFEIPQDSGKRVTKTLSVPPDLISRLRDANGGSGSDSPFDSDSAPINLSKIDIRNVLEGSGIDLDASTQLTLKSGKLEFETTSAADDLAVSGMIEAMSVRPIQHKLEMSIIELTPGTDWTPPDAGTLDHAALQSLLADVNAHKGVSVLSMPAVTSRSGTPATIEMIRELIVPTDEAGTNFETHNLGKVVKFTPEPLGLGQQSQLNYSNTTGGLDPVSLRAAVDKQEIDGSGFIREGGTRVAVETRPDGSRTVVLTTPTLIDATGTPLREADR